MPTILEQIHSPEQLRKLSPEQLPELAQEIRDFILDVVSVKEGHLASSLGVVELTIALHYLFNTPDDNLIWDVGHQAYPHKILTQRKELFQTNRQWGGLSGFPSRSESPYDSFGVGHSSTSISAALGMACACALRGETHKKHIAVVGDASIVSGISFEALNNASTTNANLLIILNDNCMSIDNPVGGFEVYLQGLRRGNSEETFFKSLQIPFLGSVDGHHFPSLFTALNRAKAYQGVQILHIKTIKGKGLECAERDKIRYHSPGKFNRHTGEILVSHEPMPDKYQDIFGKTLLELATLNPRIVGITPAMLSGSSLNFLKNHFPERTFDVGISEQHAVTFSAGLACQGLLPYCVIYSTFLQRAYDQLIHDVALQGLSVIFCVDRAGLVGEDGATHQGVFDIAYLRCVPNLVILAPSDGTELRNMLYITQLSSWKKPVAIRYPRGRSQQFHWQTPFEKIRWNEPKTIQKGQKIAILSVGTILFCVKEALEHTPSHEFSLYDMRCVKPLNLNFLTQVFENYQAVITIEEGTIVGGFASAISDFARENQYFLPVFSLGIPDEFIPHGSVEQQCQAVGLDPQSLAKKFSDIAKKIL